jgi:hypothetical protein
VGVVGGASNTITSAASGSFLGGGNSNQTTQTYSVLVGGQSNTTSGYYGYVGGGYTNSTTSSSTVTTQATTTVTSGSTAVTLSGSNASIKVGQLITGTGKHFTSNLCCRHIGHIPYPISKRKRNRHSNPIFLTPHGVVVGGGNNPSNRLL